MKIRRFCKSVFLLFILSFMLSSCNDDTNDNTFEVFADAYIVKKLMGDEVKTAAAFYAYANSGIASVTITPPIDGGELFELSRSPDSSSTFFKEPDASEFKTKLPTTGTYQFDVKSTRGENILREDLLETPGLEIPVIDSTSYQPESFSLKVNWQSVQGADGYVIKLLSPEGLTTFISFAIAPIVRLESVKSETRLFLKDFQLLAGKNPEREVLQQNIKKYIAEQAKNNSLTLPDDLAWNHENFLMGFVFMWDHTFWSPEKGEYLVDNYCKTMEREFGGLQSVILWHSYPNIGIDERNQFDFFEVLPGGIEGLKKVVNDFHRHGVKVFITYN
ncbi:MAG: hypothetical protein ACP5D9_12935, partial [Mariniphaga sp.]